MGRISVLALIATAFVFGWAVWAMAAPFAYITNSKDKTVSVLDTATNAVTTTVPVAMGAGAIGVSPDGARVYVAGGDVVSVLDTATNTVTGTVRVGSGPFGLAVTPDGRRVYVSNYNDGTVSVIDTATHTVATTIPVGQWPFGVAVEPDGSRVYVAVYGRDSLATIDTATNTVTTAVAVGTAPFGIAVTPDGARVYVANYLSNDVSVVSTSTNTVIATVSAWANPHGIAVTPDGSRVYVANFGGGGSVLVIATSSNTPIATVSGVGSPWGVAITPDGSRVYAADYWGNAVSVIATATNTVTATIPVGTEPWAFGQFIGPDVRDRVGVFRSTDGTFYLDENGSGVWEGCGIDRCHQIGLAKDVPLTGDWTGNGASKVGVFRPSDGTFYLDHNGNGVWDGCELDRCAALGLTEAHVYPVSGLAALDDTPSEGSLSPTPALIDGNLTVSAGINIGLPGLGGDTRQRNAGLDFLAPQELNSLQVWVDRDLPFEIANAFVWEVYTSTDNLNWTLYQAAAPAPFGPFLTRFEISFPKVTTRYIKVVTRPLSAAVIIPPGFANPDLIFLTEVQAFLNQWSTDRPLVGDWDGTGPAKVGLFRPADGTFYLDYNGNGVWEGCGVDRCLQIGLLNDTPLIGDWNGTGTSKVGAFRPSDGTFYLDYNGNGVWDGCSVDRCLQIGLLNDTPLVGDWSGSGTTKVGVFRPSDGVFYLDYNGSGTWEGCGTDRCLPIGLTGDTPLVGDWDGTGTSKVGVFRPADGTFYLDYNGSGTWEGCGTDRCLQIGMMGDMPLVGKW